MARRRFSIYDKMEEDGVFEANPANSFSRGKDGAALYQGPIEYPKMYYHPEGEEEITVPAEIITTPMGPKEVGEQRQMVTRLVGSREEEEVAIAEGWHDHPAKAIKARVELQLAANPEMPEKQRLRLLASVPAVSAENKVKELEAELARLKAKQPVVAA